MNMVNLSVQVDNVDGKGFGVPSFFEYIFVVIFSVELAARYNFENGWRMLLSPWNLFDFLLLVVSFVELRPSIVASKAVSKRISKRPCRQVLARLFGT